MRCPYLAFDEDLRQAFSERIQGLVASWEEYWGRDVFDEPSWIHPGSVTDGMTE